MVAGGWEESGRGYTLHLGATWRWMEGPAADVPVVDPGAHSTVFARWPLGQAG